MDKIFYFIVTPLLGFYEKHIYYRIQFAYGRAIVRMIKNHGMDLRIHGRCTIFKINELLIGDYVRIGGGCFFHCEGGIEIGNNVQISRNVSIYSSNHNYEGKTIPYDLTLLKKHGVEIHDHAWIGRGVSILPGVVIGEGSIIGMNAVITKNTQKGQIVVGSSQRIIGSRNIENFDKMKIKFEWFGKIYPNS